MDFLFQFLLLGIQLDLLCQKTFPFLFLQDMRFFCIIFGLNLPASCLRLVKKVLDCDTVIGKTLRVGQLFQDSLTFHLVPGKECCELPLRQHRHTSKLFKGKADGLQNGVCHICRSRYPVCIPLFHFPLRFAVLQFLATALHPEEKTGTIIDAVIAFEYHFAITFVSLRNT